MDATRFKVLLAEDDPVSCAFLREAVAACGGDAVACTDGPTALSRARNEHWDVLVIDQHLPGLDGDAVLRAVRDDPTAAAYATPAIATTAEPDSASAGLLRAGFAEVLPKPLTVDRLRAALARQGCQADPLDDADALQACGSPQAVEHLRRLFAEQELPRVQRELDEARHDRQALRQTLHRLRASCGFCGATALGHAAAALHATLTGSADAQRIDMALAEFARVLRATRRALHARLDHPA